MAHDAEENNLHADLLKGSDCSKRRNASALRFKLPAEGTSIDDDGGRVYKEKKSKGKGFSIIIKHAFLSSIG